MAKDLTDTLRDTLTHAVRDVTKNAAKNISLDGKRKSHSNPLSGAGGVAAGAGLAALAPLAAKGAVRVARRRLMGEAGRRATGGLAARDGDGDGGGPLGKLTHTLGDAVGDNVGDKLKQTVDESGGVAGVAKQVGSGLLPFGGGDGGGSGSKGTPGVGKGRRMPVQQSMDVAVPIETAYNQWTQYEDWPTFMHRVTNVSQDDPCTVKFSSKIWAKTKEFSAKIETQRPDERIKWRVEQGISHTGVVTFHELAPRLTRIELSVDVDPGSLLEKAARGMRHIKRAMRADMHRFKAFIEMQEMETGAWRGVIEDGELVEDHDPEYDEEREYSEAPEGGMHPDAESESDDEGEPEAEAESEADDEGEAEDEEEPEEDEEPEQPRPAARRPSSARRRQQSSRRGERRRASSGARTSRRRATARS